MQFRRDLGKAQAHFFAVWETLCQGGALPAKTAIGLRELRLHVANYVVIDLNEQGQLYILHSGTGLDEIWERNITGCVLAELVPAKSFDLLNWFFKSMIKQPCGGHSEEIFTKQTGACYQMDFLYLPVVKEGGDTVVAAMADIKALGPTDYVHLPKAVKEAGQVIQYADFIDIGCGVPAGYFEG